MKLLTLDVTSKCNLNCSYCYVKKNSKDMDFKKIKSLLDEARSQGFTNLGVSGGEPLLRNDLLKVIQYAKEKGYFVKLNTNGTLLTNEFIKKLKPYVEEVQVTIDGDKKLHNQLRSKSYDKTVMGLKKLINNHVKTCVVTVLSKDSYYRIPKAISLCRNLGVDYYRVIRLIPHKEELRNKVITKSMNDSLINYLGSLSSLSKPKIFFNELYLNECNAGQNQLGVNPDGTIVPCIYYQEGVGKGISDALKSPKLKSIIKSPCKGCKALAHYCGLSNDPRIGGVLCRH